MNKNEKLAELETRQRELADEIRTLRETPPRREPQPGDVWLDPDVEDGLLLIIEDGVDVGVWLDNYAMTGFTLDYIADYLTYLGKFTDLYRRQ